MLNLLFWFSLGVIVYTFVGYGVLLSLLVAIKRVFVSPNRPIVSDETELLPHVTILVAAFNEEDTIEEKITNTLALNYPYNQIQYIFITDGSNDRTADIVRKYSQVELLHKPERLGKMAAIKRAVPFVKGDIIVFTDANTFLNSLAIKNIVRHYQWPKVGAVAGEKRIVLEEKADASTAGEGFYWKYESWLKKLDYQLYSNVGAAGELFSIRTSLYPTVEPDTIIDDHMIAMRIAEKGFIIAYEPESYAVELASENSKEELKRKIRIAAGGMQSIFRLPIAANPFRYPLLTFQYISHRVLRWTIVPFLLAFTFVANLILAFKLGGGLYTGLMFLQLLFYSFAVIGLYLERSSLKMKVFFIPYYFCLMNYAVVAGVFRFFNGKQSAAWEKSKRKK